MSTAASVLDPVRLEAEGCTACGLAKGRTTVVFGEGNPESPVMFVGEGPGRVEDETGRPFVGPAGQLLDKILASVELDRTKVYITNVVKCRPPGNRNPEPAELAACDRFLSRQLELVDPKIVVVLGNVPKAALLGPRAPGITRCRGNYYAWRAGTVLVPFFHPSYLLRNEARHRGSPKWLTWQDIRELRRRYDLLLEGGDAVAAALEPTAELPA